jgi:hypothetical protein
MMPLIDFANHYQNCTNYYEYRPCKLTDEEALRASLGKAEPGEEEKFSPDSVEQVGGLVCVCVCECVFVCVCVCVCVRTPFAVRVDRTSQSKPPSLKRRRGPLLRRCSSRPPPPPASRVRRPEHHQTTKPPIRPRVAAGPCRTRCAASGGPGPHSSPARRCATATATSRLTRWVRRTLRKKARVPGSGV